MNMDSFKSGMAPVRYLIDFKDIPELAYGNPLVFLGFLLKCGPQGFADFFNGKYKKWNETAFAENPKVFTYEQFVVQKINVSDEKFLVRVVLPDEHEGSMVWCREYIFAYLIDRQTSDAKVIYFTIEESVDGVYLCRVGLNRDRSNYGKLVGNEDVVGIISRSVFFNPFVEWK